MKKVLGVQVGFQRSRLSVHKDLGDAIAGFPYEALAPSSLPCSDGYEDPMDGFINKDDYEKGPGAQ